MEIKDGRYQSRHRYVYWHKLGSCWQVLIPYKGKIHWVGYFEDEEEAGRISKIAMAYLRMRGNLAGLVKKNRKVGRPISCVDSD